MTIPAGKTRKPVTLDNEVWDYLYKRAEEEGSKRLGRVTFSHILNELVLNDIKVKKVFRG